MILKRKNRPIDEKEKKRFKSSLFHSFIGKKKEVSSYITFDILFYQIHDLLSVFKYYVCVCVFAWELITIHTQIG